jgi:hypothetical protein
MRVRVAIVVLALVAALVGVGEVAPAAATVTLPAPTPVVNGNKLIDTRTNSTFVPHGADWPSFEYACWQGWGYSADDANSTAAAAMASWRINIVRVPLAEDCWLGTNSQPSYGTKAGYRAAVAAWVSTLNAAGIAVILDLHYTAPGGSAEGQHAMADANSVPFWTSVASQFASNPSVIFDVFNEPYSRWNNATKSWAFQLTWSCWKGGGSSCQAPIENDQTATLSGTTYPIVGMTALVAAVRAGGAAQPIMLGGLDYSNDLTGWLANRPADSQLIASFHNYQGQVCDVVDCWNSEIAPVAAAVPVLTGEFGESDGGGAFLTAYMSWADAAGLGYVIWAWWHVSDSESLPNSHYALVTDDGSYAPKVPSGTTFNSHLAAISGRVFHTLPATMTAPQLGTSDAPQSTTRLPAEVSEISAPQLRQLTLSSQRNLRISTG